MALPRALLLLGLTAMATTKGFQYEERALQPVSPLWFTNETRETYVNYPAELREVLDLTFQTLMRSPELYIFTTVPEPEPYVWPLIKGITLRNHLDNKILWTMPNYFITDGLNYGCREMVNGQEEHVPVESTLCDDHCIHQGRYCAPFQPFEMPAVLPVGFQGKELVKESLRRLCFDGYYHASDTKYFEYLEGFQRAHCLDANDVTECSLGVIKTVDHASYAFLEDCVAEVAWDQDVPNPKLEQQLQEIKKQGVTLEDLPRLDVGGELYQGEFTTEAIFTTYCNKSFVDRPMHPIACDICGHCQDVRRCLWILECDGKPLDPVAFLKEWAGETDDDEEVDDAPANVTEAPQNVTDAPPNGTETLAPLWPLPAEGAAATFHPEGTAPPPLSTDSSISPKPYHKQEESSVTGVIVMLVVIICVAALVAAFITYRDRRTKFLMAEIYAEQAGQSAYRDDEDYVGYVDDIPERWTSGSDLELSPTHNQGMAPSDPQPPKFAFLPAVT